jgi:hypothetical protein
MTSRLTDLFNESQDLSSFENSVIELNGDFNFDRNEMLSLGAAYLFKFPDRKKDRDSDEVRFGYRIARVCITEILIKGLPLIEQDYLRRGFRSPESLGENLIKLIERKGCKGCYGLLDLLNTRIGLIHATVNTLPKGLVRERFTGGISTSFNYLYLFKLLLEKNRSDI